VNESHSILRWLGPRLACRFDLLCQYVTLALALQEYTSFGRAVTEAPFVSLFRTEGGRSIYERILARHKLHFRSCAC